MLEAGREVVRTLHGAGDGRIGIAVVLPVYAPMHEPDHVAHRPVFAQQARDWLGLAHEHGLALTQDGHRAGTLALARREFSLLGERAFMSHCIDLTEDDIAALRDSGAKVVHNPSAIMSIRGRCPVPELIDAGITVAIGSDGAAPDRGYDMFRHMWQCMHYHRRHARDPLVLPHGKVLEMATIDAARAIGLDNDIGSLEAGKRADLILVDLFKRQRGRRRHHNRRRPHPDARPARAFGRRDRGAGAGAGGERTHARTQRPGPPDAIAAAPVGREPLLKSWPIQRC
jgi:cytosine/adenosine deaminase-related metal-dependent hydrolase